jgi:hypothetical protein
MKPRTAHVLAGLRMLRFYIPHLTALGVAILAGLGMGIVALSPRISDADPAARWPLPHWTPYKAGPSREEMSHLTIWAEEGGGKRKVDIAAAPPAPPWRFIGTVQEGKRRLAVIEIDQGRKVQRLDTGETLPNGAMVVAIGTGELTYTEDDTQKTLKLFAPEKDKNFPSATNKK